MPMTLKAVGDWVIWLASFGGAVLIVWRWVAMPLKKIIQKIEMLEEDMADVQGDRLNTAHTYHTGKGFCPKGEKVRLVEMYERYTAKGRNHLMKDYVKTLIALPDHPPNA